jgi:hypothetical protein
MIRGISSADPFIRISNGDTAGVYYNASNPSSSMVRYYNNHFQVYDGFTWLDIPSNQASVGLSDYAVEAIEWSLKKMKEEKRIEDLAKNHPAVNAAYENFKRAEEQLKATIYLSQYEEIK